MTGNYSARLDGYVDVAERIRMFRELYPQGSLQPADPGKAYEIVTVGDRTFIVYIAAAYRTPDDLRPGIGMAWEPFPGRNPYTKDSELMVAETSAWGRAIKAALLDDRSKVASLNLLQSTPQTRPEPAGDTQTPAEATPPQKNKLRALAKQKGYALPNLDALSKRDAHHLIEKLLAMPDADEESF